MALTSGARLGAYEILAPLGQGGMGEVYRARDTKLDRDVAVKVLPPHLADNPAALARFEREAKAVAALSHPNILAIFDFGSERGTAYLVTELLDGQTLREKLNGGQHSPMLAGTPPPLARAAALVIHVAWGPTPTRAAGADSLSSRGPQALPTRKAVDYAVQILRGLSAAHAKGIAHRDLKPENVFVTTDGRVKILDFGLARQTLAGPDAELTRLPTLDRHTDPGTVLGTVGYMSPEQVRGEAGDSRSDLFSFGAVLYELLSGRRAFLRETAAETMTAILREDPPALTDGLDASLPAGLARLVQHCLEKGPGERFQSASDVAFALEASSGASSSGARALPATRRSVQRWLAVAGVAAIVTAVGAASFLAGRSNTSTAQHVSFTPLTYQQETIFRALFAPDGKTIVFSAALKGTTAELFSLSPEYPEPRSLGLSDAQLLSVSSKNELAILTKAKYLSHRLFTGTLARMPLGGGAPREILENVREADWSPDGATLAIIREANGRDRLEFPAGKVLYETSGYVSDLRVSPAGDRIAFFEHPIKYDDRGGVAVVDLTGKKTTLADGYWGLEGLAWSPEGREVLFSAGLSYAQFKVYAVSLSGILRPALESAGGLTLYDVARDGRWLAARDDIGWTMRVMAPGAREETNLSWLDFSQPVKFSSDRRVLLFTEESGAVGNNYAVCLRRTDGSPVVRLGEGFAADLSSDGKWVLAVVPGSPDQLVVYPTGAGESRRLDSGKIEHHTTGQWFPDGTRVLVCGNEPGHAERCYVQDIRGSPPRAVTPEDTHAGFVSPDSSLVLVRRGAESAAGPGVFQLYPLAGGAPRDVAGLDKDDRVVRWSPDGRSLIVSRGLLPARVERVEVATGRRDLIRVLSPGETAGVTGIDNVVVADDPNVYAYTVRQNPSRLFLVHGAR